MGLAIFMNTFGIKALKKLSKTIENKTHACDKETNKRIGQAILYQEFAKKGLWRRMRFLLKALSFFEGNDGVLYHTKFFTPLVFQWNLIKNLASTHDDFWFKMCCLINGHGVVCLHSYKSRISEKKNHTSGSALHFNLNAGTYQNDLKKICSWFNKEDLL